MHSFLPTADAAYICKNMPSAHSLIGGFTSVVVLGWRHGKEVQFYIAGTKTFFDFLSCIRNHSNVAEVIQWLISNDINHLDMEYSTQ